MRIRSLWLMQRDTGLAIVETISLAVTVVLARAEARTKPHHLPTAALATLSREQLSGLYGRGLFLWLARTLWDGRSLRMLIVHLDCEADLSPPRSPCKETSAL